MPENQEQDILSSKKLKPCPFCGGEGQYSCRMPGIEGHNSFWPEYTCCHTCRIYFRAGENGVEDPVKHWNNRGRVPKQKHSILKNET